MQVLMQPRNALGKQFAYQFELSGTQLVLTPGAQRAVAGLARVKGTGARGLRSILEKVLLDALIPRAATIIFNTTCGNNHLSLIELPQYPEALLSHSISQHT